MNNEKEIQQRRQDISRELLRIRSLRPGNINEQYVRTSREGKPVTRGPYPVLCWREGKKVFSERLRTPEARLQAKQDIGNYKRFKELCKELETLTRQLGCLERDKTSARADLKKKFTSRSNKAGK